jgi:hypothetical protein
MQNFDDAEYQWETIPYFEDYAVNARGTVIRTEDMHRMQPRLSQDNQLTVSLRDINRKQVIKTVKNLVAQAFVPIYPKEYGFNTVIQKDLDPLNVCAENLSWRSRTLAMRYKKQFISPPAFLLKSGVIETSIEPNRHFESLIDAAKEYGLLMGMIYIAALNGTPVQPTGQTFKLVRLDRDR